MGRYDVSTATRSKVEQLIAFSRKVGELRESPPPRNLRVTRVGIVIGRRVPWRFLKDWLNYVRINKEMMPKWRDFEFGAAA